MRTSRPIEEPYAASSPVSPKRLSKVDLVNHPLRLRILEVLGPKQLSPKQIAELLKDIPQATLYRHLSLLHEGGLIEVVATRQAHGIVESTYAQTSGAAHFTREEFASLNPDDHKGLYALLAGSAGIALGRYFKQANYNTTEEGMTYFTSSLSLTDERARQFRLDLLELVQKYSNTPDADGRARLVVASVIPEPNS